MNVVVAQGAAVLKLLSSKDQSLLVRRNPFLVLDFGFDIVDGVAGFDLEGDGLSGDCNMIVSNSGGKGRMRGYLRVLTKICMIASWMNVVV